MTHQTSANRKVAVVYFSASGTTAQLAGEIAQGTTKVAGVEAVTLRIDSDRIAKGRYTDEALYQQIDNADVLVMGSPTYMGGPAAQFKCFADGSSERWYRQAWHGKLATGLTVGGNANGDKAHTLQYFSVLAGQHSMLWCGLDLSGVNARPGFNRLGSENGLIVQTTRQGIDNTDLQTARYFGEHIARTVQRLN